MNKFDAYLEKFLEDREASKSSDHLFITVDDQADEEVDLIIMFDGQLNQLSETGFKASTVAGNIVAGSIAIKNLKNLLDLPSVLRVELSRSLDLELDKSVGEVTWGGPIPNPNPLRDLDGSGVIIGIIDNGIKWDHPFFLDKDGLDKDGKNRISLLWDQNLTVDKSKNEKPPSLYNYGVEYQFDSLKSGKVRHIPELHGTHVAGIAAGNDTKSGNDTKYHGVAPNAEIIFVSYKDFDKGLVDAINYILCWARKKKKPVVINFSSGRNAGAHNGQALIEKQIDNLLGKQGEILIKSAGNIGDAKKLNNGKLTGYNHANCQIKDTDPVTLTLYLQEYNPLNSGHTLTIELWYPESASDLKVILSRKDNTSLILETNEGGKNDPVLGSIKRDGYVSTEKNLTHKSIIIEINLSDIGISLQTINTGYEIGTWSIELSFTSPPTQPVDVHAWLDYRYNNHLIAGFVGNYANNSCTVTFPGNAKKIITVGNYKIDDKKIFPSSSRGPTVDGRIVPTICAPGTNINSATNANIDPPVTQLTGTSMAAPHVTGVVALMLQANPTLTQEEVRDLLTRNCRIDAETRKDDSVNPTAELTPNNTWGWGRVNGSKTIEAAKPLPVVVFKSLKVKPVSLADLLIAEVVNAFLPLSKIEDIEQLKWLCCELGLKFPDSSIQAVTDAVNSVLQELLNAYRSVEDIAKKASNLSNNLNGLQNAETEFDFLDKLVKVIKDAKVLIEAIKKIPEALNRIPKAVNDLQSAYEAESEIVNKWISDVKEHFAERLINYLTYKHIETRYPKIFIFLILCGVLSETKPDPQKPCTKIKVVDWSRIPLVLFEPSTLIKTLYFIEKNTLVSFNLDALQENIEIGLKRLGIPVRIVAQSEEIRKLLKSTENDKMIQVPIYQNYCEKPAIEFGVNLIGVIDGQSTASAFVIPYTIVSNSQVIELSSDWLLTPKISFDALQLIKLTGLIDPPNTFNLKVDSEGGKISSQTKASLLLSQYKTVDGTVKRYELFSLNGGTKLTVTDISLLFYAYTKDSDGDIGIDLSCKTVELVISTTGADSFISTLLPNSSLKATFDINVIFSAKNGISFKGSTKLDIKLNTHIKLGPIDVKGLLLQLRKLDKASGIAVSLATDIKAALGPLKVTIEEVGLKQEFTFLKNLPKNIQEAEKTLGALDYDFKFKPPTGAGLILSAGAITGGGFLKINHEEGEYRGGLVLSFKNLFTFRAIAIINTKLPNNEKGFSLFVMITAEFQPIQLSFGFTLNGVGGLFGYNRTVNVNGLNEMVRTGQASLLLFPPPTADLPAIVNTAADVYPVQVGNFVFGPMGKIGWGTPTVISAEIGIIIEVPDPVRIGMLGVIRVGLPDTSNPVISLNMIFFGVLDFAKKEFSLQASLYDSKIVSVTISGDFAMLISWGENPLFIFSAGGFHPSYKEAPPSLNNLRRLTLSLIDQNELKIGASVYLAVTANTVQFGAHIGLWCKAGGLTVNGQFWFDALFKLSPFSFQAGMGLVASVKLGKLDLGAVTIHGLLTGPGPWHVRGEVTVEIWGCKHKEQIDRSWADELPSRQPSIAYLKQELLKETEIDANWESVSIPGTMISGITVKNLSTESALVLMPNCQLIFKQRLVPLGINIDKFGEATLHDGVNRFSLSINNGNTPVTAVTENFARSQYFNISDNEKLSTPSFEKFQGGVSLDIGSNRMEYGSVMGFQYDYEVKYLNSSTETLKLPVISINVIKEARAGVVYQSVLSREYSRAGMGAVSPIHSYDEKFVVVRRENLQLPGGNPRRFNSYTEAEQALNAVLPNGHQNFVIMSELELEA